MLSKSKAYHHDAMPVKAGIQKMAIIQASIYWALAFTGEAPHFLLSR